MALQVTPDGFVVETAPTAPGIESLDSLLQNLPGFGLLTGMMKQRALDNALTPDSFGLWPGQAGYERTYDYYFAAASLIGFLAAQPVVRSSSSEGTSVAVDPPNWTGLVAHYRSLSPIVQAIASGPLLTAVPIPGGPHVRHVNMRERVLGYDNVDTDLG